MLNTIKDLKSQPASSITEPVTLTEVKLWCIIDHTDDDTLLTSLITRSRLMVENKTHLSLVEKNVVCVVDLQGEFKLPLGPVRSITSIEFRQGITDDDPDWTTLTNDEYTTYGSDFIRLKSTKCGIHRITYVTGYTDSSGLFPIGEDLKSAVLTQENFMYENRGDVNSKGKFSDSAMEFLKPYKDYAFV